MTSWGLCLVRRGCFRYRGVRSTFLIDPTVGLFEAPGVGCDVSHPVPGGDRETLVMLSDSAFSAVGWHDLELPIIVHTTPWVDYAHRRLVVLAEREPFAQSVQMLGLRIVAALLARAHPGRIDACRAHRERATRALVDRARALLTANPNLTLLQLAAMVDSSPHQLSRGFVRHTGAGLAAHRVALRTSQMLDQLADCDCSLADVAAACGFADHAHMTRTARRRFGAAPSTLRVALTAEQRQRRHGSG